MLARKPARRMPMARRQNESPPPARALGADSGIATVALLRREREIRRRRQDKHVGADIPRNFIRFLHGLLAGMRAQPLPLPRIRSRFYDDSIRGYFDLEIFLSCT